MNVYLKETKYLDFKSNEIKDYLDNSLNRSKITNTSIIKSRVESLNSHKTFKSKFKIVKNHIGIEKLLTYLKKEEIVFHAYVEVYLNEKWVKCTPAFDKRVCLLSGVKPLDWDGENDSMFQEFQNDKKFMEYVFFYGEFDDVPIDLMNHEMKKNYPHLFEKEYHSREFSFHHI